MPGEQKEGQGSDFSALVFDNDNTVLVMKEHGQG